MVGIILDYYFYQQSYLILKSKNLVKFCVHISPIFSCSVTYSQLLNLPYSEQMIGSSAGTSNDKSPFPPG